MIYAFVTMKRMNPGLITDKRHKWVNAYIDDDEERNERGASHPESIYSC